MSENDKNVIQKKEETEQEMQTPIHDSQEEIVVSINLPAESSVSYTKSKSSSNSNTTSTSSKSNLPNYISKLKPIILPNLTENFKTPRPPLKEKTFEKSNELKGEVNLSNSDNKKTANNEINRISSKKVLNIPRLTSSDSEIAPIKSDFFQNHLDSHKIAKIRSTKNFNLRKINLQNLESLDEYNKSSPKIKFPAINVFENENFVTFSDSNSPDDDPTQSIKATGINMKKFLTKDIKCKDIEIRHSSLLSVPSTICRICQTNTANEKLLSPCYCKGSLAYVHLSCLERWLNQSSRSYCELCLYQYNAVATLRYGLFEGIRLWIKHPRNRNHVRSDCLIAFLLTLITLGLLIICLMGMDYFMIEGIKLGFSKLWTKSFIVSFLAVIMLGYIVTIYLIAKDQFVPWYNWWKNTLNIHLVINQNMQQSQRL